MTTPKLLSILSATMLLAANLSAQTPAHTFAIGTNDFLLDGQKLQIRCGEIHAARVPMEYWRHRLQMAKAMGLSTVCAYSYWNQVEFQPRKFDTGQFSVEKVATIGRWSEPMPQLGMVAT